MLVTRFSLTPEWQHQNQLDSSIIPKDKRPTQKSTNALANPLNLKAIKSIRRNEMQTQ